MGGRHRKANTEGPVSHRVPPTFRVQKVVVGVVFFVCVTAASVGVHPAVTERDPPPTVVPTVVETPPKDDGAVLPVLPTVRHRVRWVSTPRVVAVSGPVAAPRTAPEPVASEPVGRPTMQPSSLVRQPVRVWRPVRQHPIYTGWAPEPSPVKRHHKHRVDHYDDGGD